MIQRIQSIYLLLAAIFLFVTLFLPLGNINGESVNVLTNIYTTVLSILSGGIALIAIFLFNNRKLQIKVIRGLILLCIATILSIAVFQYALPNPLTAVSYLPYITPAVATIFSILALKGVKADERLVRSMDRLR